MKEIRFKQRNIFYGKEFIGSYKQHYADRFIPTLEKDWEWIYNEFDFYEGQNLYEFPFKEKFREIVKAKFDWFRSKMGDDERND